MDRGVLVVDAGLHVLSTPLTFFQCRLTSGQLFARWLLHCADTAHPELYSLALLGARHEAGLLGVHLPERLEQLVLPDHLVRSWQVVFAERVLAHVAAEQQPACCGCAPAACTAAVVRTRPAWGMCVVCARVRASGPRMLSCEDEHRMNTNSG